MSNNDFIKQHGIHYHATQDCVVTHDYCNICGYAESPDTYKAGDLITNMGGYCRACILGYVGVTITATDEAGAH